MFLRFYCDLHIDHFRKKDNMRNMKDGWSPFGWVQLISKGKPSAAERSGRPSRGSKGKVRKW